MAIVRDYGHTGAYLIEDVFLRPALDEDGAPDRLGLLMLEQAFGYEVQKKVWLATQWLLMALLMGVVVECFTCGVDDLLADQHVAGGGAVRTIFH